MNFTQFIADLKDLINLEPAKRNLFISIILFVSINGYLYSDNHDLKEQIKESKKNCDEVLVKAQSDYLS